MAKTSPYSRFAEDDLTLRDLLAVERTAAANERTLLGYIRTTLALLLAGGSLVKFIEDGWLPIAGWVMIGLSAPLMAIGAWHYLQRRTHLTPLLDKVE